MSTAVAIEDVPCLICETLNTSEAIECRECSAPMALVHDSIAQERAPQIVSIVGDSNVGKTVYLGFLLDMLSQRANDFEAIPRGAYSVNLPQQVISHMAYRMFPPKTPVDAQDWYWAYFQVGLRGRKHKWIDLVMPDMAGEAIAAEIERPKTFTVIRNLLGKSSGVLLLVDAAQAANGSTKPDFFALKMLSYIDSIYATKRNKRIGMPIGVVLCKGDYCPECFDDPAGFTEANLNRTWNFARNRLSTVSFFATSVVGSLGYATSAKDDVVTPVPLHTALRGVMEPFEWIGAQI